MPVNTIIAFCAVMMVLTIATKMVTGSAINATKRQLARLQEQKWGLQGKLDHARERKEAARNTVAFYEARKHEVSDQIAFAEEEIREIEAELESQDKPGDKTVGVHDRSKDVVRRLAK